MCFFQQSHALPTLLCGNNMVDHEGCRAAESCPLKMGHSFLHSAPTVPTGECRYYVYPNELCSEHHWKSTTLPKKNNLWYMCRRIPSFMVIYHVRHMVSATPPWAPAIDKAECETWKDLLDLGPNGLTIAVLAARQPEIGDVTPNSRIVTIRACENVEGFLSLSKMSYLCLSVCLDAYS